MAKVGYQEMDKERLRYLIHAVMDEEFFGMQNLQPGDSIDIPIKTIPEHQKVKAIVKKHPVMRPGLHLSVQDDHLHVVFQPGIMMNFSEGKMHFRPAKASCTFSLGTMSLHHGLSLPELHCNDILNDEFHFMQDSSEKIPFIDTFSSDFSGFIIEVLDLTKLTYIPSYVYQNKIYQDTPAGLAEAWKDMKSASASEQFGREIGLYYIFTHNNALHKDRWAAVKSKTYQINELELNICGYHHDWAEKMISLYPQARKETEDLILKDHDEHQLFAEEIRELKKGLVSIQELIDTHLQEIQDYALSHPYNEQDRFQIVGLNDMQVEPISLLFKLIENGRETACVNQDKTLSLDWHLPEGAVGNAFKAFNRINAFEDWTLPLICKKVK